MNLSIHLAPNAPWPWLVLVSLALGALGVWAYRFVIPPLPALAKRLLPALRIAALVVLLALLAQPVLERPGGSGGRLVILLDRSHSMDLPAAPRGATRAQLAERVAEQVKRSWHGGASAVIVPFAGRLGADSSHSLSPGTTALGDVLADLGRAADRDPVGGVVVVSDGIVNAGEDPADAARALGIPVTAVVVGRADLPDRAIASIEASSEARVGKLTPVRVHVVTTEPRGATIPVTLFDGTHELGRTAIPAPGSGAEATAEFHVTPLKPGLALWTARVDSLAGEITTLNNARDVAVDVAPERLGVMLVSGAPNWDFTFVRRALAADSSLKVTHWIRERDGYSQGDRRRVPPPGRDALRGETVVVLDAIAPPEISPAFDEALHAFVAGGGAVLALGGEMPGIARYHAGAFSRDLAFEVSDENMARTASPEPTPESRDLTAWDDDPARGASAWRSAAPLSDLVPVVPGAGDRVLVASAPKGPPLLFVRRIGRGQVLLVNGTGIWRWSLSGTDELSGERGRRLWRALVHALAEPVQGEPLRLRPERWLSSSGEVVRLYATLQDADFHPLSGATVEGEVVDDQGRSRALEFGPGGAGSYIGRFDELPPGHYRVSARAHLGARELGRATSEFAVDRFSLEAARTQPDSATLAAVAGASGGRVAVAGQLSDWSRALKPQAFARARTESVRLWESPWVMALVVAALSVEWAWRRRRGLP